MGEFGCTQFRTSSSCSFERKRFWKSVFWVRNILPRGLIGLLTKKAKKCGRFLSPRSHFRPNFGVIGQSFWRKCSPIIPSKFQENANTGEKNAITEIKAHVGQNWPKSAMRVMRILRAGEKKDFFSIRLESNSAEIIIKIAIENANP